MPDIRKFFGGAPPKPKSENSDKIEKEPAYEEPSLLKARPSDTRPSATPPGSKRKPPHSDTDPDSEFVIDISEDVEPTPKKKKKKDLPTNKVSAAEKAAGATPSSTRLPSTKKQRASEQHAIRPDMAAAIAAVDAALEALPTDEASMKISFMPESSYQGRAEDHPPNKGVKPPPPRGHPDCLTGKTFVISGVLDSLTRGEAEDFIKRHGGKVTSAVSGKTTCLVMGLYAGKSKFTAARTKGKKFADEDGLFSLVASSAGIQRPVEDLVSSQLIQDVKPVLTSGGGGATGTAETEKQPQVEAPLPKFDPQNTQLWVEKYRPKTSADLVGNASTIQALRHWLQDWERVHLHGGAVNPPAAFRGRAGDGFKKKAVLLSGPPGIGKTSSAIIVCKELGIFPVEVNASDTRGKADASVLKGVGGKLANALKELSTNVSISRNPTTGDARKLALVMDEVDGMSAGDRGGVADLIQTIHKSKIPVICICNDKYSTKLRSLRNHCMELDYRKPTAQQISKRMLLIAEREGLAVNQATMEALVQSAGGGDIRLILGQLQMLRLRAKSISYDQVKSGMGTNKDLEMSPFEAARRLLDAESVHLSLSDQIDLFFQDADLVPLLVQENYLNHKPRIAGNDLQRLQIIAKAADGFSAGDTVSRRVRQYQDWGLMPFAAVMGTIYPSSYMRGHREVFNMNEMNFPRFTSWLGNNSSFGKQKRLLGELHTRMMASGNVECDRTSLRLGYLPVLRRSLTAPLMTSGKEGIPRVLGMMKDYCISREDLDFISDVTKFKTQQPWGEDPMKSIETQVKSAFTRAFNQQHIKPKTGFGLADAKKKGRGRAPADDEAAEAALRGEEDVADVKQEDEEEEEELLDPVMVRQKLMGLKHSGMNLTLKDGTTAQKPARGRGGRAASRGRGGRGKK